MHAAGNPEVARPVAPANCGSRHSGDRAGWQARPGVDAARVKVMLPLHTVSTMNRREHWPVKARRAKEERLVAFLRCPNHPVPCTVTLTRIAPRELDGDNLQASFKHVRDGIADRLKVDDRDKRVTWLYGQRKGKPREYAVEVEIA